MKPFVIVEDEYDGFTLWYKGSAYGWDHNDPNPGAVIKELLLDMDVEVEYREVM